MILPDHQLIQWAANGGIEPFNPAFINPASVDLRLGFMWRDMTKPDKVITDNYIWLTPSIVEYYKRRIFTPRDTTIYKSVLAITYEWVRIRDDQAAEIKLKTTPSRKGLGHPIADWVDPGYEGKLTLMLHAFQTIKLEYLEPIVQIVVHSMHVPCITPYGKTGHYQGQMVPTLPWDTKKERR